MQQIPKTPTHSVAMVGIVYHEGRVLCIQRMDNGRWEPPAGVLELEETFQAGVEREIFEETQVRAKAMKITGVHKEFDGHPAHPVTIMWLCQYVEGEPAPTEESRKVEWLTLEEVSERVRPAHAIRILDAVNSDLALDGPSVVYHNGHELIDADRTVSV